MVFSRGDQNLANCLWNGTELHVVDLEYCGWNDRAFDLASLVEHIQSRGTPGDFWEWFIDRFDLSPLERRRFKAAQRRLALAWLLRECIAPNSLHSIPEDGRIPRLLARAVEVCGPSANAPFS
jgi:thiamine kinase-like enzyme